MKKQEAQPAQENNSRGFFDEWGDPIIFGTLAVACLLIYGQTVGFDFINLDDHSYVYLNEPVLSGVNSESIKWSFLAFHSSNWHPLTWLSHAMDIQLFGLNPGAHHAMNVILHLANSCLAYVVFRTYTGDVWKSALIAILFAVHPAHVESVAWISERKDVLSTLFWLLTMLAYYRYATSEAAGGLVKKLASPYYLLTFILLGLGLMAKPMLVTLPFVLLLLDVWPLKRWSSLKDSVPLVIEKVPLFALSAASCVITFMAQKASGSVIALEGYTIGSRFLSTTFSYAKYVWTLFYPADLGVWYPFTPTIDGFTFIASLVLLLGVTAAAIWQFRKRPYIAVGWFWFVGTMIPVIGLVQVGAQAMADRYTYIPYFGLFIIVVWGAAELIEKFEIDTRVAAVVVLLVIGLLGFTAFKQAGYWKNAETLYTRSIAVTKENYFLMNALCQYYIDKTPAENAERRCTELFDNVTNYMEAHNTIGLLRVELGRYDDALISYSKALQIKPDTALIYSNMAVAFAKKGDTDAAEKHLQKAIELADKTLSREALAYTTNALGEAYVKKNEPGKARAAFERALKYDPESVVVRQNLANLQGAN